DFLADHLISPDGAAVQQDRMEDRRGLTGGRGATGSLGQGLGRLGGWGRAQRLRKGGIVGVGGAAHVLPVHRTATVAALDPDPARKPSPGPVIPAREVSERLGELAEYGCRVVVLLDGVHELPGDALRSTIKPWVRDLQQKRRVITFVASREGPSL